MMTKSSFADFSSKLLQKHRAVLIDNNSEVGSFNDLSVEDFVDNVFDIDQSEILISKDGRNIGSIHLETHQDIIKSPHQYVSIKSYSTTKQMSTLMALAESHQNG